MHLSVIRTSVVIFVITALLSLGFFCQAEITCLKPFSCTNANVSSATQTVRGAGYKSIYGNDITIYVQYNLLSCDGESTCSHIESFDSHVSALCMGLDSCSNINGIGITGSGANQCVGTGSCSNGTFIPATVFACGGYKSCQNAIVVNTTVPVSILGAYSFENGIIHTANEGHSIPISIWGYYSADNASIYCYENDNCDITCWGNACYNTFVYCYGNCTINCNFSSTNTNDYDNPFIVFDNNDIGAGYCPTIITKNTTLSSPYFSQVNVAADHSAHIGNSILSSAINADICDLNNSINFYYDKYNSTQTETLTINASFDNIDGNICCRGYYSCQDFKSIEIYGNENNINNVICSASSACRNIDTIKLHNFANLHCHAYQTCQKSTVIGDYTNDLYCIGGSFSCSGAKFYKLNNVIANLHTDVSNSEFYGVINMSIYQADVVFFPDNVKNIDIMSNGIYNDINEEMTVNLLGYYSGNKVNVYCNETDICNINCMIEASCLKNETIVYCYGKCNIYCPFDDAYCPTLYCFDNNDTDSCLITSNPTLLPTSNPTFVRSKTPSMFPSSMPVLDSTSQPSVSPTSQVYLPSGAPSKSPTANPVTQIPSAAPTISTTDSSSNNNNGGSNNDNNGSSSSDDTVLLLIIATLILVVIMLLLAIAIILSKKGKRDEIARRATNMNFLQQPGSPRNQANLEHIDSSTPQGGFDSNYLNSNDANMGYNSNSNDGGDAGEGPGSGGEGNGNDHNMAAAISMQQEMEGENETTNKGWKEFNDENGNGNGNGNNKNGNDDDDDDVAYGMTPGNDVISSDAIEMAMQVVNDASKRNLNQDFNNSSNNNNNYNSENEDMLDIGNGNGEDNGNNKNNKNNKNDDFGFVLKNDSLAVEDAFMDEIVNEMETDNGNENSN